MHTMHKYAFENMQNVLVQGNGRSLLRILKRVTYLYEIQKTIFVKTGGEYHSTSWLKTNFSLHYFHK